MTIITQLHYKSLAGGAFAMGRFNKYAGTIFWQRHSIYKGYEILRAFHIEDSKPCALYAFHVDEEILVVAESLASIKEEASHYKRVTE